MKSSQAMQDTETRDVKKAYTGYGQYMNVIDSSPDDPAEVERKRRMCVKSEYYSLYDCSDSVLFNVSRFSVLHSLT